MELAVNWNSTRRTVDWEQIGTLSEVVFLVEAAGDDAVKSRAAASGTVYLECRFGRLSLLEAILLSPYGRLGAAAAIGLLAALLVGVGRLAPGRLFLGRSGGDHSPERSHFSWWRFRNRRQERRRREHVAVPFGGTSGFARALLRDVAFGTAAVLTACVALAVQELGARSVLDSGYVFLGVALAGGLVGQLWKFAATGRMLTAGEAFCDVLATGLLAASSSSQTVWQAPTALPDLVTLSGTGAMVFVLVYHLANAYTLATAKAHLSAAAGAVAVATPYAFGLLLALESENLAGTIGNYATCGWLADRRALAAALGRVVLLLGFNEFVAGAICFGSGRQPVRAGRVHLYLLLMAAAAIAAPWMADLGSGAVALPAVFRPVAALVATVLSQGALGRWCSCSPASSWTACERSPLRQGPYCDME